MRFLSNPLKGAGLDPAVEVAAGEICRAPGAARELFAKCPVADVTPLRVLPALADQMGVGEIWLKDERTRMGLGSFKALGAAHAIAKLAAQSRPDMTPDTAGDVLKEMVFVCASAGNHGLSMAAGARVFGARAVVYLSAAVPETFAGRLRAEGARVVRQGADYEASLDAALCAAKQNHWYLLSDSSWLGYSAPARDVMEGYLIMGAEVAAQIPQPPTHIFLQAGVGGLAAACAASARNFWGQAPRICVVEPDFAPALINSIEAGEPVIAPGPASNMGRLDCKEPSHLALKILAREADAFMTVSDDRVMETVKLLAALGMASTPSGVAGLAGLQWRGPAAEELGVGPQSRVLVYITEGPEVDGI